MISIHRLRCAGTVLLLSLLTAAPSAAQIRGQVYVSGLTHPVAFVQDPSNPSVQYVVQKEGAIRVISNGTLLATPFLDLSGQVATEEERGLVSLAFAPNYAATGRFFVTFTNPDGNTVIARFLRSAGNPLVADPGSRFDLQWSTGLRVMPHPIPFHIGGQLAFNPIDGYLYIALGDGGATEDATHEAQNPSSLLGKFLRIDVNVSDTDPEGFNVPADNPFVGGGGAPEVWSLGLRNPWRYSFDSNGALIIGDVGENTIEEIDYEPYHRSLRNYGWRNREGAHDHIDTLPMGPGTPTDPIHEYDHGVGRSVTGGYIYRGTAVPALAGRYVFGDFVRGRVWSLALTIDPSSGEATASDLREHTAEINQGAAVRLISSFGVDANGELYVVNYGDGTIVALRGAPPAPVVQIDSPVAGTTVKQPFQVSGWALDPGASTRGISTLHVYAYPSSGAPPQFLGVANYGTSRPDLAAIFGPQFANTGFNLPVKGLAPGVWWIVVYGLVEATQTFSAVAAVPYTIEPAGLIWVDVPAQNASLGTTFFMGGWAVDPAATSGTGIATIHVWAYPANGGPPTFVGVPAFGNRPDVAAYFGPQFLRSGFGINGTLPPGTWYLVIYAFSTVSNSFDTVGWVIVNIT